MTSPRYYQQECIDAVYAQFDAVRSTLVVQPTGSGKSVVLSHVAAAFPGRVLILAHRKELVMQARDHIERATGIFCDVEMASRRSYSSRIVVGSVQSVVRRLRKFTRNAFDLVIIDECHHATSRTYTKIIEHFCDAKVLGVTATPDRGDGEALGGVFDSVAYRMDILDGIDWGYLCPVEAERVHLGEIDLRAVKTSAGDLQIGQLDEVITKAVNGVVIESLARCGDRQAIAFFPGIRSAMLAAEAFNHRRPECARFVCGETDAEERDDIMRGFRRGDFQFLCNVGVATEGFDHPGAEVAIIARPTKSRSLYCQMAGRVTRVLPDAGIDSVLGPDGAEKRRELIAGSTKPKCLVLDFYGNAGAHSLCTPVDLLSGKYSDEEIALAKSNEAKADARVNPLLSLAIARAEMKRIAELTARARAITSREKVDPFKGGGFISAGPGREIALATDKQVGMLRYLGYDGDPRKLPKRDASKIIDSLMKAADAARASMHQLRTIGQHIPVSPHITPSVAHAACDYIRKCREAGTPIENSMLRSIVGRR